MSDKILITGASGQLGQAVLNHLLADQQVDGGRIIAVTRNPDALAAYRAKGVQIRQGSFDDAASLDEAFEDAARILVISTDAVGVPGKRVAQHKVAVEAAKRAGAQRILYTSMVDPANSEVLFAPDHTQTEEAIIDSGIPYTILRASWYQEGLLNSLPNVVKSGKWVTATNGGKLAHLSRDDIGAAAAAALVRDTTGNEILTLTGEAPRSYAEIAALVSETTGKPVEVVDVDDAAYAEGLRKAGLPDPIADLVTSIERNIRLGKFDTTTGDYEMLTGREPQPLKTFIEQNKAAIAG